MAAIALLVGNIDQLPSFSLGQILADLINSGRLPVTHCWQFRIISDDGVVFVLVSAVNYSYLAKSFQ